jgi:hypothetical protein
MIPVKFTTNITQGEKLIVLGYPKGDKSLSTTQGRASRVELHKYVWSSKKMHQ